jgi:nucleoside-diphosphate-sugar epimerase
MQKDNTILVTGATGFLGSYLVRMLHRDGYKVRGLRRASSKMDLLDGIESQIEWAEADVTDVIALEEAMQGVDVVFHTAAMVSFHPKDLRRMMQVNVEGTANVVNLCLHLGIKKLVHVSSIASLGRSKEQTHLDENTKWTQDKGTTNYSLSKYQSEQEVWRGQAEGLSTAIVNPSIILGSGFWDIGSAKLFKQVFEGLKFWPPGRSGFVDVRDVARSMILLMEQPIENERYVLSAQDLFHRDLFNQIAALTGKKPPVIKVTPLLAEVAWRVEWLKEKLLGAEPIVTRESARSSLNNYTYGNEKSLKIPGFSYTPMEKTIAQTCEQLVEAAQEGFTARVLPI